MPIDFSSPANRNTYALRVADQTWTQGITALIDPQGLRVADIGCGGGIYSTSWLELGAESVVGVDFSAQMIEDAVTRADESPDLTFLVADATATGLADHSADLVFQRALVHHLNDPVLAYREAKRILSPAGRLMIQDRTMTDVRRPGSPTHLRGYFFELYPRLLDFEAARRPKEQQVEADLRSAGFSNPERHTLAERRRTYTSIDELSDDLAARTGRSILHELSSPELERLIDYISARVHAEAPIEEIDYWTVWIAARDDA
ncbi:methyltransferase domain-containing protein [Paenarthrobacter sp. GOM3]|uniref:class I SAM-dependent methyltransferase n=1 Tax=Paenarthrobacter sp. GOM3 TaxID=2782567 RepID=UPI001BA4F7EF|nr:class I SAM-dependent methyltransferase [Paenarthrobacter sp. GOM3]WOH17514.1 methyltransferase domain-containing protein [Paenarthrobacter sp. GOM3]